ncbi:MAG: respiratory nitrate reductase subunit gamma [Planctomycetota bacterium]
MTAAQQYLDQFFLVALPYMALVLFFVGTIQRYRAQKFTYSSLSSQFLENQHHFYAMVPFHYGILVVLAGHVAAFLLPRQVLWWNGQPVRLYVLEVTALLFGVLTLIGMLNLVVRRLTDAKTRSVTSANDWVLYALLLTQVASGIHVAVFHPWGASWFAASITPYLRSILFLNPDIQYVVALPFMVKLHIVGAFLVIGFFPFTRLVHILVVPNPYLWRRPQIVRWYGRRSTAGESPR